MKKWSWDGYKSSFGANKRRKGERRQLFLPDHSDKAQKVEPKRKTLPRRSNVQAQHLRQAETFRKGWLQAFLGQVESARQRRVFNRPPVQRTWQDL